MLDYLIKNAMVVDGTGAPAYPASVGVLGDKIAEISRKALCRKQNVSLTRLAAC